MAAFCRGRRLRRRVWPAAACAILVACSGSEGESNGSGDDPHPDARAKGDDGALGDGPGADYAGGDGAHDGSIFDNAPDDRDDGGANGLVDRSVDVSPDDDVWRPDRDGPGNTGFDIGACVPTASAARRSSVALYLLLDNSASMNMTDMQQTVTRWAALSQAIPLFVDDVANEGLRVGVDFFPENGDAGVLCAVSDYLTPAVKIAVLGPMSSHGAAVTAGLAARSPAGTSAIVPALTAALQHARDWANSQAQLPAPIDVVLLVDGPPTGCTLNNNTMAGAEAAARAALVGTPPVRTHVLAFGADPGNWSSLAVSGGTNEPVYVAESTGAAIAAGLRTVRAKSTTCEVALDGVTDTSFVNFEIRDADAAATMLRRTDGPAGCGTANAWYLGAATQPKSAVLCPTPCAAFNSGASIATLIGCRTVILPP